MLAWKWPEIADRPFYVSYCMSVHLCSAVRHNSIGRPKQSRLQYLNPLYKFWLQILQIINEELVIYSDPSQSAWDQWVTNYQQKAKQDRQDRQKTGETGKRRARRAKDQKKTGKTGKTGKTSKWIFFLKIWLKLRQWQQQSVCGVADLPVYCPL